MTLCWSPNRSKVTKFMRQGLIVIVSAGLAACSNLSAGNLFSHYSQQTSSMYQLLSSGQYSQAIEQLPDGVAGDILDNMERGRLELLNANYPSSLAAFNASDVAVKEWQQQASVSISESANTVGSFLTNDNLRSYQPSDYELGFLHLYLSLNYLKKGDLEGALVEVRRANLVQEQAKKEREKELRSAERSAKEQGISPNLGSVLSRYPSAGKTLQEIQNGYLFFYSGLLFETEGNLNSAYIDYKRALAVAPDNNVVIDATLRTATKLGMRQDLAQLTRRYGKYQPLPRHQGRVIVIDEQSVVKALQSWKLPLPLYDSHGNTGIYNLALPYYPNTKKKNVPPLRLNEQNITGSTVVNVNAMAERDLTERLPAMVVRQALRIVAKDGLRKTTRGSSNEELGNLLFNIYNTLSEQPDTRSWQTLPAQVQLYSETLSAGKHRLSWNGEQLEFDVSKGKTTLIWASRQGISTTWWQIKLGEI